MALDYYLDIEGIGIRLSTKAFSGVGDGYTYLECIRGISSVSYDLDPIELTASVGVLEVRLVDEVTSTYGDGILTNLFGWRQPDDERLFLDTTIQEADVMGGAATFNVVDIGTPPSYPATLYIERETFTATGNTGNRFDGVTREKFGSRADRHTGYSLPNGYRPMVTTYPRYWANRWAKLVMITDDVISGGDPTLDDVIWQGPISALSPAGLTGWTLRIGSVMRLVNKRKVFCDNQPLKMINSGGDGMRVLDGPIVELSTFPDVSVVREGLSLTQDGNAGAASDDHATCTTLTEPNDYWNSRHAIHWTSGNNVTAPTPGQGPYDLDSIIFSFTKSTGVMEIQDQENNTISGNNFEIIKWNSYPARSEMDAFWAVIDEELVFMQLFEDNDTDGANSITYAWQLTRAYDMWAAEMDDREAPMVGLEGCEIADHAPGVAVQEVLSNYRYPQGSIGVPDVWDETSNTIQRDWLMQSMTKTHPLEWLLEVLTSTGLGYNGTYDVLPPHHAAAFPSAWVDLTGIMAIKQATEADAYRLAYTSPLALKDLVGRDICAPLGLYPAVNKEGQFTFKRIQFSNPSAAVATITEATISADRPPQIEQGHSGIISSVVFRHDWQPFTDKHKGYTVANWTDADQMYPDSGTLEFDTHIWLGLDPGGGNSRITHAAMSTLLQRNAIRTLKRASSPMWLIRVNLPLKQSLGTLKAYELRPGDVCNVTLGEVPMPDGTRGLDGDILEVVGVRINPLDGTVDVTMWLSLYDFKPGGWNWSAEVTAWDAGNKKVTVSSDLFLSGEDVTDYVVAGDKLRLHFCASARAGGGAPYGSTEELTVASCTADTITFTGAPLAALVARDVVSVCDYDSATTAQQVYSHWAEANDADLIGDETLGAADDSPKVWL